jgi:hypothetical protein
VAHSPSECSPVGGTTSIGGGGWCKTEGVPGEGPIEIRSNLGAALFELDGPAVRLARRGLDARLVVYELEPGDTRRGIARFLRGLADDWKGWAGERSFSTLEGELTIDATHNGWGTVELKIAIGQKDPTNQEGIWSAVVVLYVDAGSLSQLAGV